MSKLVKSIIFFILFYTLNFSAGTALANNITVALSDPSVTVSSSLKGLIRFEGSKFQMPGVTGEPQLPYRVLKVLLPPEAELSTVSISLENIAESKMTGLWDVNPVPPMATWDGGKTIVVWPEGKNIVDGRDVDIYETDAFFPQKRTLPGRTGEIRGWKVVDIPVALFRYNPVTRKLIRLDSADIVVNYSSPEGKSSVKRTSSDPIAPDMVRNSVINYDEISPSYTGQTGSSRKSSGVEKSGYLIITTEAISDASFSMDQFVSHKEAMGFDVSVITEEDWGGSSGDVAAENIRSWLTDNYISRDIKYILLIGNPNPVSGDIPMKMLWPRNNPTFSEEYKESPSDLYYQDMTGNWDLDGDGFYGEWNDDFGEGGIDTNWDIVVGRIPVYDESIADLDSVLAKTINYENADPATAEWRKNVLLPMVPSDEYTPGYHLGEAIKDNVLTKLGDRTWCRVYDEGYGLSPAPEFTPCSTDIVTDAWANDHFGAVFWWTHGSETVAWKAMDVDHVPIIDDEHPSIVFQCSCLNAYPERSDNLSWSLLKNGAVVTIGATRVSWYSRGQTEYANSTTNAGITYGFAQNLMFRGMTSGMSLADAKQSSYLNSDCMWMNFTDFNVLGDPSLKLNAPGSSFSSITVNIDGPDEARWSMDREGSYTSGTSIKVPLGVTCNISFNDISGWIKPQASTITVDGEIINVSYEKRTLNGPAFVKEGGSGDGSSWDNPKNLADAIRDSMSGEEIWVAEGLYLPEYDGTNNPPLTGDERGATFPLKSGVKIYGGFPSDLTGTTSSGRDSSRYRTILTGNIDGNSSSDSGNSFHVVTANGVSSVLLDGITITGGQTDGASDSYAAGLLVNSGNICLNDCTFSDNSAAEGGGMTCLTSEVILKNCVFIDNVATLTAAGAYLYRSTVSMDSCHFENNSSDLYAGALKNDNSEMTLEGCTFTNNRTAEYGGAMELYGGSSLISSCTFNKNSSKRVGGAFSSDATSPTVKNCTFSANKSVHGSAIYCSSGTAEINNCTFTGNLGDTEAEGTTLYSFFGSAHILNSIFWDDTRQEMKFAETSATPTVDHCVVSGDVSGAAIVSLRNIITDDPLLGSLADNGGPALTCSLSYASSALDAGVSNGATTCDQRGINRPQGPAIDIGAYEVKAGLLHVFTNGPDNATWSIDGKGSYHNGDTAGNLQIGRHRVAFTPFSDWKTPASQEFFIEEGETILLTGDYNLAVARPASWSHVNAGKAVTLTWEPFSTFKDPVTYAVYIMNDDGNFVQVPDDQVEGTSVTLDLNGHTTYTLRVDANGFEGEPWTFTTPNRAPLIVRRSPVNNSGRLPANTVLSWLYEDPDGDSIDYFVYMSDDSLNMKSMSLAYSGAATNFTQDLACDNNYSWQIEARDRFVGMEAFEAGITSSDAWTFNLAKGIQRITSPVSDDILVTSGVNDVWVTTLDSTDLDTIRRELGMGVIPAEEVLSMDIGSLPSDVSSADRKALLEKTGTSIIAVLTEGFQLAISVSDDVNLVPVPVTLSFSEKQVGQILDATTLLDNIHIFVIIGDNIIDLVSIAGDKREKLFSITSDKDESGTTYFVSFRLYLVSKISSGKSMGISSTASSSGTSLFTETEDPSFLIKGIICEGGTFKASVMEATVTTDQTGSGGGCIAESLTPAFLMLLIPMWALKKKRP